MATRQSVMKWARIIFPLLSVAAYGLLWLQKNESIYIIGLLYRLVAYILFVGMFIFTCILVNLFGPPKHIYRVSDWEKPENQYIPKGYDEEKYNIRFDSHFHTIWSDGKMSIEQGILWHLACGFNAFVVTDHGVVQNKDEILRLQEKYKEDCIILPGVELNVFNGHMNVIGYRNWDEMPLGTLKSVEEIKEVVELAHKQGAVVTWNHYPWSYGGAKPRYDNMPSREEVLGWGVDYIEASNWDDDINTIDDKSYKFCKNHEGISPIAGTDVHSPDKDRLWSWTLLHIEEFTPEGLMEELRAGRTEVFFKREGVEYPTKHRENPTYKLVRPLSDIGELFINLHQGAEITNVDWKSIGVWFGFVFSIFGLYELTRFLFL